MKCLDCSREHSLIDLDKFVESLMWMWDSPETEALFGDLKLALDKQGLEYKDGKIVKTQLRGSAEAKENDYGESEDDTIRRIINCLKGNMPDNHYRKECIAWLEMQGQKPIVNYMK